MSPEQHFAAVEEFIRTFVSRMKHKPDGVIELEVKRSGLEWVDSEKLEERWTQDYVKSEFKHLGFTKIEGPFPRGPDFRVMQKNRWAWAEVETRWQRYFEHGHDGSPAFVNVKYLIILSDAIPPEEKRKMLPPNIIYINHDRFCPWFESASRKKMDDFRIMAVANRMQEHFLTLCSDTERDGATCPHCNECCYFGEGLQQEATPLFGRVAAGFIALSAIDKNNEVDLRRIDAESVHRYLEHQMLDM